MARLQCPYLFGDPEQIAEKVFDVRGQLDEQIGFRLAPKPLRIAPRRHQPIVQRDITFGEMANKHPIDARQTVAVVEVGEIQAVRENEVGHREQRSSERRVSAPLSVVRRLSRERATTIRRASVAPAETLQHCKILGGQGTR